MPVAVGRVLGLVRKLIEYGKDLASALHRRAAIPGFAGFARPFGEADVTIILARVTNGLRLAAALEARLCQRAARGHDLKPAAIPLPVLRGPRATRQAAQRDAQLESPRPGPAKDPRLARLPTEDEISTVGQSAIVG
jgi:hypothetical protein